jgi:hypothetical protein
MASKYKLVENGYSLITMEPVFQIVDEDGNLVDAKPRSKDEAEKALKALQPAVEEKKAAPPKKAPVKKTTAKKK